MDGVDGWVDGVARNYFFWSVMSSSRLTKALSFSPLSPQAVVSAALVADNSGRRALSSTLAPAPAPASGYGYGRLRAWQRVRGLAR